jgi:hypothetical protein
MPYIGQADGDYFTPTSFTFKSIDEAARYCFDGTSITWQSGAVTYGDEHYWPTPEETLCHGAADCKGMALLFLYLVHTYFGVDGILQGEATSPTVGHVYVDLPGGTYNQVPGEWKPYKTWTYGQAMWIAENTHGMGAFGKSIAPGRIGL